MHFIFRKSDGVILYTPATARQFENEWAACLANEGGTADDYEVVEADGPIPRGTLPTLVEGVVTFPRHPEMVARDATMTVLRDKLKNLGLTDDEINALRGG
jgi:hypothetical protein